MNNRSTGHDLDASDGPRFLCDGDLQVFVRSEKGARSRNEDAWQAVFALDSRDGPVDAFAVFDGLGGVQNGHKAALAAREALASALASSDTESDLVARLNAAVLLSGGATTAAVATLQRKNPDACRIYAVGDSGAYVSRRPAELRPVNVKDIDARGVLTNFLGRPGCSGRHWEAPIAGGEWIVLCTDGIDRVLSHSVLQSIYALHMAEPMKFIDEIFARVEEKGAPDNATLLVARRNLT